MLHSLTMQLSLLHPVWKTSVLVSEDGTSWVSGHIPTQQGKTSSGIGSSISLRGNKARTKAWEDHAWGQVPWPHLTVQAPSLWESAEVKHEALEGPACGREYNKGIGLSSIPLLPAAPQMLLYLGFPCLYIVVTPLGKFSLTFSSWVKDQQLRIGDTNHLV